MSAPKPFYGLEVSHKQTPLNRRTPYWTSKTTFTRSRLNSIGLTSRANSPSRPRQPPSSQVRPLTAGLADPRACASSTAGGSALRETIATSPLPSGPTWMTRRGAGLALDGLAEIATVARLGVRGPSKATRSPTACAVPSLSPLSSNARPSSAYYVTNGPRRAGTTPSRTPTSTRGADAWRRIALKVC